MGDRVRQPLQVHSEFGVALGCVPICVNTGGTMKL